ncbi:MAG: hypothetical protein ACK4ND_02035 [Cytophagaceae bacterium]
MMKCVFIGLIGIFLLTVFSSGRSPEVAQESKTSFVVNDFSTGETYFTGVVISVIKGEMVNRTVSYFNSDKKLVQKEQISYNRKTLGNISYSMNNYLTGGSVKTTIQESTARVIFKENGKSDEKEKSASWSRKNFHSVTLNDMIKNNWDVLLNGDKLSFNLLVESRFDTYGFQFVPKGQVDVDGEKLIKLKMDVQSSFLKPFMPRVEYFYTNSGTLRMYEGPSPVESSQMKGKEVKVTYTASK